MLKSLLGAGSPYTKFVTYVILTGVGMGMTEVGGLLSNVDGKQIGSGGGYKVLLW
jgi:hypothetical protein